MLNKVFVTVVLLLSLLKENAAVSMNNYRIKDVNRIEFGRGNKLNLTQLLVNEQALYYDSRSAIRNNVFLSNYMTQTYHYITYCTYNQQKKVIDCHLQEYNDRFVRIYIEKTDFIKNSFSKDEILTQWTLTHCGGKTYDPLIIAEIPVSLPLTHFPSIGEPYGEPGCAGGIYRGCIYHYHHHPNRVLTQITECDNTFTFVTNKNRQIRLNYSKVKIYERYYE
ncbi:hypothetical protein PIROE2DRAFT_16817 [Piromyces sp. E2]|nr:hypothetical protein PIROE2DRAFT_16817 [Piromyces sp. E2]|eukprot:OUM58022.1 hypothetical protein PIROE2DRAFT_16817 [Piromyces sp. E2]